MHLYLSVPYYLGPSVTLIVKQVVLLKWYKLVKIYDSYRKHGSYILCIHVCRICNVYYSNIFEFIGLHPVYGILRQR